MLKGNLGVCLIKDNFRCTVLIDEGYQCLVMINRGRVLKNFSALLIIPPIDRFSIDVELSFDVKRSEEINEIADDFSYSFFDGLVVLASFNDGVYSNPVGGIDECDSSP